MPKPASTRPAYKMLTCIYLCRTLLFFAPYADFFIKKITGNLKNSIIFFRFTTTFPEYFIILFKTA